MMDRYFSGETFSEAEIRAALRVSVCDSAIVPMTMGSNTLCQGVYTLIEDIIKYFPSPENRDVAGINMKTSEIYNADYDFSKAKSAYVFSKTVCASAPIRQLRFSVLNVPPEEMVFISESAMRLRISMLLVITVRLRLVLMTSAR